MQRVGNIVSERVERIIVENEMLRAGFAAFPYLVMKDTRMSGMARFTYAILLMFAWQEGSTFAGQGTLAKVLGVSVRQLQRYLDELKSNGYIEIERKDKRFTNTYIIKNVRSKLKSRARGQSRA